ncbi:spore coat protein GerQ [Paenibacillus polymyxa]|uniref:spore coat protein GerQ n=1 Tax=Paenibacillus polymyxa TaxID=1406 RepID=UPI00298C7BB6|nr:spore coat protein GerQ [Paenibacillus polymyxa]
MISQQAYRPVSYPAGSGYPEWPRGMNPVGTMQPISTFPPQVNSGSAMTPAGMVVQSQTPQFEQSYIENILRLNLGKTGTFYMTYENNREWNAKIFKGILEAAGRDHIIISDPATGKRTILLMVNLDYATFDEPLLYQYPGVIGNPGVSPVR